METKERRGPLTGVKVIDFSWVGTGPMTTRELAYMGARVVRIESHRYPDPMRLAQPYKDMQPGINRSAFGMCYNTNKCSVCLRLDKPKGREIARKLIMWADVLVQGMTSNAMEKWELDYENVKRFKPDIIYFSTNQPGLTGPYRFFGGYGIMGGAYAGWESVVGYRDLHPVMISTAYTDFIAPWYGACFIIAALDYRRRTGRGMLLDQSQWEAGSTFLGSAILDYIVNGRIATPLGNRRPYTSPSGVFRCTGGQRWVAISVETDEQWQAFCRVVGEDWTDDLKFGTVLARKQNEDELERLIGEWTANKVAEEVMQIMQDAGVPAGVVQNSQDLVDNDPQVKHRRAFEWLDHKEIGPALHNTPAYRLSKTPHRLFKAGPCIGEDNDYVYKDILGYTDEDIADFLSEGVIDTIYDAPSIWG
jgi:benzylsuccinate CoA-transferase BbsF subunit